MATTTPRKDPASDSYHLLTLMKGGVAVDPATYDGYIAIAFRDNGDVVAKFSKNVLPGYEEVVEVTVNTVKKIKIFMRGSYTKGFNNEIIYCKVFTQLAGVKVGPKMDDAKKGFPLVELCESQLRELPDMDPPVS